ncbi:MAG: hybrid sensor histidine kinase/response regulator [Deltaproteobacteria bacterium]|nr:hybrid sensor histidine kinase/response regulator [Deltaproteobacteria bacterium]
MPAGARSLETVLIVDDDEDLLDLTEVHLSHAGFSVHRANSGEAAIVSFQESLPNLVLLDVLMPGLGGFETYAALRALPGAKDVPIVFMTALNEGFAQQRALELGAQDILFKPINPHELLIRVRSLVSTVRIRRELAECVQVIGEQTEALGKARKRQDEFVQFVVHDLRSPLTGIAASAGCGAALPDLPAEARALFEDVTAGAKELTRRVNDILDVLGASDGVLALRVQRLDVAGLCRVLCQSMAPTARAYGSSLTCAAPTEPVWLQADRNLLTRALNNLVDNALRHAQHAPVEVRVVEALGQIELRVIDAGPGIPEAARARVFDKYAGLETGERRPSGLGLAFCRSVALAHGGRIWVEPNSPSGACFCIALPRSDAAV